MQFFYDWSLWFFGAVCAAAAIFAIRAAVKQNGSKKTKNTAKNSSRVTQINAGSGDVENRAEDSFDIDQRG